MNWILYRHMHPFCATIERNKLRVNWRWKQIHFFMFSKFIRGKKGKETKHILLPLYNLNDFLLLSHPSLFLSFCLFFGNIFKMKSSLWYYDVSTSLFSVFNINTRVSVEASNWWLSMTIELKNDLKVATHIFITIIYFFLSEIIFREKMVLLSSNDRFDNDKIFFDNDMITFGISL